ncbi:hypothetical protein DPX16_19378 [Anabarilius grahami]|uniref:Uncharacterized protein n=1 Tax=Anabarilius grahami TaxID=495550 RepID=A0A3N0YZY2_ANAGA|nr:hypothetical protein DPX16_19378 [Anabarilius grahami]
MGLKQHGYARTTVVERFQEAKKQAAAFQRFLPRRSKNPPEVAEQEQPRPSTSSSAHHRAQQKVSVGIGSARSTEVFQRWKKCSRLRVISNKSTINCSGERV